MSTNVQNTSSSPLEQHGHRPPRRALVVLVLLAGLAAYFLYDGWSRRTANEGAITASATVEGEETTIAAELSGRVRAIAFEEGASVRAGDVLITLDDAISEAQLRQARSAVDTARAGLAVVRAPARAEDVRAAEAQVAQAVAGRDAADRAVRHALELRDDPQDLNSRIDNAEAQVANSQARYDQVKSAVRPADVEAARSSVQSARTGLSQAESNATSQEKVAREALAAAEAKLKLMTQGPRPEDVKAAELAVDMSKNSLWAAQTNRDGACGNARNPQYLCDAANSQVAVAETNVQNAENALARLKNGPLPEEIRTAEAAVEQARATLDNVLRTGQPQVAAARAGVQSAEARLNQVAGGATAEDLAVAATALDQARRNLADLKSMRDKPYALDAQVDATRGQADAARAATDGAQAKLDALKAGATRELVAVSEAQVAQAEAALALAETQAKKLVVTAPSDGVISHRLVRPGEVISTGAPLLTLSATDPLKVTVYVPEPRIGQVSIGQVVELSVDAFPGEVFKGKVTQIATRAEFTPRNVQTQNERSKLVFAIKAQIPNADGRLKAGMPTDARLITDGR